MQIYVAKNNQQHGPYSVPELQQRLASGTFTPSDLGWHEGIAEWRSLSSFPYFNGAAVPPPPVPLQPPRLPAGGATMSPVQPVPETSGLAIASLVLGILSMLTAGLTALPAVICGHLALSRIEKSAGRIIGRSMAMVGLVMGYIFLALLALGIVAILAGVALPVFGQVRERGLDTRSLANARSIAMACRLYAEDHGGKYPPDLATLAPDYVPNLSDLASPRSPDKSDVGYEYVTGLNISDPPETVLLRDKYPSRRLNQAVERRAVVYLDGHGEIESRAVNELK